MGGENAVEDVSGDGLDAVDGAAERAEGDDEEGEALLRGLLRGHGVVAAVKVVSRVHPRPISSATEALRGGSCNGILARALQL